jgi:hypothetical protein
VTSPNDSVHGFLIVFSACFVSIVYRSQVMCDFLQDLNMGDLSISAARGHAGPKLTSPFDFLTPIYCGRLFEFFVYLSPFKSYSTFSISIENAL